MDLGQENIEIFMESNKDAFITFVLNQKLLLERVLIQFNIAFCVLHC